MILARLPSRVGWGFADQALSSLTNFGLSFLVAREVGATDFGAFGVALVTYWAGLGVVRALVSQPLVIRYAGIDEEDWRAGIASGTGAAMSVGVVGGVLCLLVGAATAGTLRDAFIGLGLSMPGLLLQDTWRFAFFAHGQGRSAFVNDLVWTIVQFPLLGLLVATGAMSVLSATLAWGVAASVAAIAGVAQARSLPRPGETMAWLRRQWDLASRFLGEVLINTVSSQLLTYAMAAIAGLSAVGTIRAGLLLLSPLNVLSQAIALTGVPEGVRALRVSTQRLVRLTIAIAVSLAAVTVVWGAAVYVVPDSVGAALLRGTWLPAHSVVFPLALAQALAGVITGAGIGIRAMAAAGTSLRATAVTSTLSFAGSTGGVAVGGALGAAWGTFAAQVVNAWVWWISFLREVRRFRARSATNGVAAAGEDSAALATTSELDVGNQAGFRGGANLGEWTPGGNVRETMEATAPGQPASDLDTRARATDDSGHRRAAHHGVRDGSASAQ